MTDSLAQRAVLAPAPMFGHFLVFGLVEALDPRPGLLRLRDVHPEEAFVVGLGEPLLQQLGGSVPALRTFPAMSGPGVTVPSTQGAIWVYLRGSTDPAELLLRGRLLRATLGEAYRLEEDVPAFRYSIGRDLTGYEDGTENPKDEKAVAAAIVSGAGPGLDGSSFVAVQRYIHDLDHFQRLVSAHRDDVIGRRQDNNAEIENAPESSHVKRSAQEKFSPEAFMVRRSLPWGNVSQHGLFFVAYGASLDPFERVMRHMAGLDDHIVDAVLRFSRPVSGGYYWCPPMQGARIDLRAIGL